MDSKEHLQTAPRQTEASRRSAWPKIIGFVGVGVLLLLIAAFLIPCMVDSETAASESTAIGSLRTICTAQRRVSEDHPETGFAGTLFELGPSGENEIDAAIASGTRRNYIFTLTPNARDSAGRITKYTVTASPQTFGKPGMRSFFIDESGVIRGTHENRPATASDPALQ